VDPRAGLDAVAKRIESLHRTCQESNPGRPVSSLVTVLTELNRLSVTSYEYFYDNYLREGILLDKIIVAQLIKKFPAFHGTRRFVTVFTTASHW